MDAGKAGVAVKLAWHAQRGGHGDCCLSSSTTPANQRVSRRKICLHCLQTDVTAGGEWMK
jgi:hypothetical protein